MITVFTGAGASKALNYPTTEEFFTTGNGKALQRDTVYKQVSQHLQKTTLDVEDFLRLLSPFADLETTPTGTFILSSLKGNSWVQTIPTFVQQTKELCFEHYWRAPQEHDVRQLYLPLLEACHWKKERVNLFTTNYDPVTDFLMRVAKVLGIACYDGFDGLGDWDSGGYSNLNSPALAIHRLHGSMSWVQRDRKITNTRDYSLRAHGYAEHLIIYPGFKGDPEKQGHPIFRFAHETLRGELEKSSYLVIIGFSFRDPHLNDIFFQALTSNHNLTMIVWNPIWPEGPDVGLTGLKQYSDKQIIHLDAKFGDEEAIAQLHELIK